MTQVSVIVPVYNAENYLEKCLNSLINQTLEDIEIICVDDCSTDSSLDILKHYAEKDGRVKLIVHTKNLKQGAARNKGIEIAKGEFITYVDSDDWVEKNYLELLYKTAVSFEANIAAASIVRDKNNKTRKHLQLSEEKIYHGANDITEGIEYHLETAGKLYRFDCIKNLRFTEQKFFEDAPYTLKAIFQCNSLVTVPSALYHYVSNPNSTIKARLVKKMKQDKIDMALELLDFADEHEIKLPDYKKILFKEQHLLYTIKHYRDRKDFYLFGIKLFSIKNSI